MLGCLGSLVYLLNCVFNTFIDLNIVERLLILLLMNLLFKVLNDQIFMNYFLFELSNQ